MFNVPVAPSVFDKLMGCTWLVLTRGLVHGIGDNKLNLEQFVIKLESDHIFASITVCDRTSALLCLCYGSLHRIDLGTSLQRHKRQSRVTKLQIIASR